MSRRAFLAFTLTNASGVCVGSLFAFGGSRGKPTGGPTGELSRYEWGFIVDTTRCIGCGSCVRACRIENHVPDTFYRTWVERYHIDDHDKVHVDSPHGAEHGFPPPAEGIDSDSKGFFVPKLCNHCKASSCTQVCPVGATFDSPDGVVLVDKQHCIGCGYCVQACPYGCRYIDHEHTGTADKCTLCYHRIHQGRTTACAQACPRDARICGDLKDPKSRIRRILHDRRYGILKPEMGTLPKCYYLGLDLEVK